MPRPLDYARDPKPGKKPAGGGYVVIGFLNFASLLAGVLVLSLCLVGAQIAASALGAPVLLVQLALATIPGLVYVKRHSMPVADKLTIVVPAILSPLISVIGVVLAASLPHSGNGC